MRLEYVFSEGLRIEAMENLLKNMYMALVSCSNRECLGCPMLHDGCMVADERLAAQLEEIGVSVDD